MRGGVLQHYSYIALYVYDDIVSLQMVEILGKNVSSGQRRCRRVYYRLDGSTGSYGYGLVLLYQLPNVSMV
jgi:hypothetical protein